MGVQFWPCPGCSRHVKRGDAICPFCGATASVVSGPTRTIAGRLSRAALFAAGAVGAAVATTDCAPAPPYGTLPAGPIPTEDASASDGPSVDAADASTTSEPTDSASTADVPSVVALYGGFAPHYGLPPLDE
jgi:hypothetical protein